MEGDVPQAIAGFALAAVPGVLVLEIVEYGQPRLRERSGIRALAGYLIVSLLAWATAIAFLGGGDRLADVMDTAKASGSARVDAYIALAWRLVVVSTAIGFLVRMVLRWIGRFAFRAEERRREGHHGKHRFGEIASGLVSMAFAWDRLLERLRRTASPQVVHVRFLDGSELFGVLAAGGSADFHADGGGLVLDAELLKVDGRLMQMPGSNGVFVSPAAVASVAFVSYEDPGGPE